ncbi:NAD(P)H-dependent oxidoreductase [Micromonospora sp. NPDC049559]|uniref:NADPH-dependent FMN reductase n=1 Tax=Micromonospora sp. NPDC049559 TaxID=3155923 RepID=UPI003420561C
MAKLQIILASTRPGRAGEPVAKWFLDRAVKHGGFDVELIDLAEWNLPMMDEPHHPKLRRYVHQHTKDWSAKIESGDAYVFVMPEYNYGFSAPLKNALDYLNLEWNHKPVGLVSYGGVSAGTRAAQMIRQVLVPLSLVPVNDAVHIPFVRQFIGDDGVLQPNETMESAADVMLDELVRYAAALKPLRDKSA